MEGKHCTVLIKLLSYSVIGEYFCFFSFFQENNKMREVKQKSVDVFFSDLNG